MCRTGQMCRDQADQGLSFEEVNSCLPFLPVITSRNNLRAIWWNCLALRLHTSGGGIVLCNSESTLNLHATGDNKIPDMIYRNWHRNGISFSDIFWDRSWV